MPPPPKHHRGSSALPWPEFWSISADLGKAIEETPGGAEAFIAHVQALPDAELPRFGAGGLTPLFGPAPTPVRLPAPSRCRAELHHLAVAAGLRTPEFQLIAGDDVNAALLSENRVVASDSTLAALRGARFEKAVLGHELGHVGQETMSPEVFEAASSWLANRPEPLLSTLRRVSVGVQGRWSPPDVARGAVRWAGQKLRRVAIACRCMRPLLENRRRELAADRFAARLTGDPEALAAALLRTDTDPARRDRPMAALMSTHPSTRHRIRALGRIAREMDVPFDPAAVVAGDTPLSPPRRPAGIDLDQVARNYLRSQGVDVPGPPGLMNLRIATPMKLPPLKLPPPVMPASPPPNPGDGWEMTV